MRLLIVKPTALGDVAQALRVVPQLKQLQPDLDIDWVVDEAYLPLIQSCPEIHRPIPFPRSRWRQRPDLGEILRWACHLRRARYEVALDLQGLARSGLMTLASGAPRRIGLCSAREGARWFCTELVEDNATHAIERYRLACAQVLHRPLPPNFYTLPRKVADSPYLLVHPYTLWDTKLWPWPQVQELIHLLPDLEVRVIGRGPWFPLRGPRLTDLRNRTNLTATLQQIAGASALLSTDSGPAHLAAAYGVPVITLFGASDPARTAPVGHHVTVLQSKLPCQPCRKRKCHAPSTMECMWSLHPETVAATIRHVLASQIDSQPSIVNSRCSR